LLQYLVVGIESSADFSAGLLVHIHIHMLLQGVDRSLYVDTILFAVFGVVSSCILDYIIDQNPRSILACFLHIIRVIVTVGDRLLMLIFNQYLESFFCSVHLRR
jgi:hypothetical protein